MISLPRLALLLLVASACGSKEAPPDPARTEDVRARHAAELAKLEADAARARAIEYATTLRVKDKDSDAEIQALSDAVNAAADAVVAAQSDADRTAATTTLDAARAKLDAARTKAAKARLDALARERANDPPPGQWHPGKKVPPPSAAECKANPLAKGC